MKSAAVSCIWDTCTSPVYYTTRIDDILNYILLTHTHLFSYLFQEVSYLSSLYDSLRLGHYLVCEVWTTSCWSSLLANIFFPLRFLFHHLLLPPQAPTCSHRHHQSGQYKGPGTRIINWKDMVWENIFLKFECNAQVDEMFAVKLTKRVGWSCLLVETIKESTSNCLLYSYQIWLILTC